MLDDILIFIKVVNHGSILTMAKQMGVAQSTISRKISALEKELGVDLLVRDNHGMQLTDKGKILYDSFSDMENEFHKKMEPLFRSTSRVSGTLKLLLPPAFSQYAISPFLGEFCQLYPDLNLECYYKYHNINMKKENYDIAIIPYLPNQSTQKVRAIYASKVVAVCSKAYLENYGAPETLEEVSAHLVLGALFGDEAKTKYLMVYTEENDEGIEVPNATRLMVNNFIQAKAIIEQGHAICCLPEESIRQQLDSGEFIRVLPKYYLGYKTHYMLRSIDENDIRYKVFDEFIRKCMYRLKNYWEF